jgi:DNA mismatch endonuclease (patch repair protein)
MGEMKEWEGIALTDKVDKEKRSWIMSCVKSIDTGPEIAVRSILHRFGFRYRLHAKDLPGRPDIVNRRRKIAIFVHGCFWHGHQGCYLARLPKSNREYWLKKTKGNQARDVARLSTLRQEGWSVLVIWQCELRRKDAISKRLSRFIARGSK